MPDEQDTTTVRIYKKTAEELFKLKTGSKDTNAEVIQRLIEEHRRAAPA